MRIVSALLVIFIWFASWAYADDVQLPPTEASELVRKLGDANFRVRDIAERDLVRRGALVLADVKRGAQDADLEIRRRCQSILALIERSDLDVLLDAFLAGNDDVKTPRPGWSAVRKVMGDIVTSRDLYARIYKTDQAFLEMIEQNPTGLGDRFDGRIKKLQPTMSRGAPPRPQEVSVEAVAAVLLMATIEPAKLEANASNQLIAMLSQQSVQQRIQWSHGARRLTEKFLEKRCDDPAFSLQAQQLAVIYGCSELIETRVRPAATKAIEAAAANPIDFNKFYPALNQARQCNLGDLIEQTLKPAVRKGIEAAALAPVDFNRLNQFVNCAQQIGGMEEELHPVLRPVLVDLVKKQVEKMDDVSRFYAILNLARMSKNDDLLESDLRPAFRATLVQITSDLKDYNKLTNAFFQAQTLGVPDEIETILKPAAESMVHSLFAKKSDAASLQQALSLAQTFGLRETLRPAVQQLVDDVSRAAPALDRLFIVIQFARLVALPDIEQVVERELKPAARKALLAAAEKPINVGNISQTFVLADQLQLKEAAPLALKAIREKKLQAYVLGQAIFQVGRHGGREAMPHLEVLLGDKTNVGTAGINGMTIHSQVGDVALASLIHLSGQKFDDYDFPWVRIVGPAANQTLQPSAHCYGFENDAARQAAQKKWRDSQAVKK